MTKNNLKHIQMIYMKMAQICAVFLFFQPAGAASSTQSVIKRAQNATLQQDRIKAIQILTTSIDHSKNIVEKNKLKRQLSRLSSVFYKEKTQRKYLYAKSLSAESDKSAIEILNEINKIEPANDKIETALVVSYLRLKECKSALNIANESLIRNPFNEQMHVHRLYALYCNNDFKQFDLQVKNSSSQLDEMDSYQKVFILRKLKKPSKKSTQVKKLQGNWVNFPPYVLNLLTKATVLDEQLKYAEKYLELCQVDDRNSKTFEQTIFFICDELSDVKKQYAQLKEQEEERVSE